MIIDVFGLAAEKLDKDTILNTIARAYKTKVIDAKLTVGKIINPLKFIEVKDSFTYMDSEFNENNQQVYSYNGKEYAGSEINYALFGAAYESTYAKLSALTALIQSGGKGGVESFFLSWVINYNITATLITGDAQYVKDIPNKIYWAYWGRLHYKEIRKRAMEITEDKGDDK